MLSSDSAPKVSFFQEHILPVLLIFIIPASSVCFFGYAEREMDEKVYQQLSDKIRADVSIPFAERQRLLDFYKQVPASRIMASHKPDEEKLQATFEPVKLDFAVFRWMKRIGWICLATSFGTLLIVGLSVLFSRRSYAALYWALRTGWLVLRLSAAVQVIGQAILLVALSYWVTAILAEVYFLKLIGVGVTAALTGVILLSIAIFSRVDDALQVEGEILSETDAPTLWKRVREMAQKLNTAPPNQIIAGVEPNFFVTEQTVKIGVARIYQGRTLYLSLPLLKVLSPEEAEAVLGHELAHFSGQDTFWSRKIGPLRAKFALYLHRLGAGFTSMVAHFMHLFWKLYMLSISQLSRSREFRADQIGADLVSKEAVKRALLKITCYCEYRAGTESTILNQETFNRKLDLAYRLEQGYPAFVEMFVRNDKSRRELVPHPFDSHPPLTDRLAHIGFEAGAALNDPAIRQAVAESWYQSISLAPGVEERLWKKHLARLEYVHRRVKRR
jgi:Zn-dependent protease with chaperone function